MSTVLFWESKKAFADVTNNTSFNQADALLKNAQRSLGEATG